MISDIDGSWKSTSDISQGTVLIEEKPMISSNADIPSSWKKMAKKISKLEPDKKPDEIADTMPAWSQASINDAIIRLLYSINLESVKVIDSIVGMIDAMEEMNDSPFGSLLKKAKSVLLKDGPKVGIKKATLAKISEILLVLTTKVCVTTEGGVVLFKQLGSIPHSCAPNCMFIPRKDNVGQLVAIRDISAGENINCSHIPTNCLRSCVSTRQAWLRGVAGTKCRSSCCTTGYDLRRRVVCVRCHPLDNRDLQNNVQDFCLAAKHLETGKWKGLSCGQEMDESEAINVGKESGLVRKIQILNEADVDLVRLAQYTKSSLAEAHRVFGKGHFCYQQLQLLNCGIALHILCTAGPRISSFVEWIRMLEEIVRFSVDTGLPFQGMDELVRIVLSPETLQTVIKLMGVSGRNSSSEFLECMNKFSDFVESSCACLVMIEGNDSVHAQDGMKLKHWFSKKFRNWLTAPESPSGPDKSFASASTAVDPEESKSPHAIKAKPRMPKILGVAAMLMTASVFAYALYRRKH